MKTEDTDKILNWIKEDREKLNSLEQLVTNNEVEPICKNCKFHPITKEYINNMAICTKISESLENMDEDVAIAYTDMIDDEGYYHKSQLITHESFGCNLFQAK